MKLLRITESKVLLMLVLILGLLEIGARVFEVHLSKDVKHIRSLPAVALGLKSAPDERLKVLIIGNSLSRDGIDQPLLKDGLQKLSGREVEIAAMYPDGSNINQWVYGYRRYFDQTGAVPDLVLIGTGRPHLLDSPADADRLSAFYTSLTDLPHLLGQQQGDVEAISKAMLARSSMLFAHRGRVQPLVFYNLVPGYTETTQTLSVQRDPAPEASVSSVQNAPQESCTTLAELLTTFQSQPATRAFIVTIPMTEPYTLPECVQKTGRSHKTHILNEGAAMRFDASHFPDGYHLDKTGAAEFTTVLLQKLGEAGVR